MGARHFLSLTDLDSEELLQVLQRATELKAMHRAGQSYAPLENQTLGLIFERPSAWIRVALEAAMVQLGGGSVSLAPGGFGIGRSEPIEDAARALSRLVDVIAIQTSRHEWLETFAASSKVSVVNALSDQHHPIQVLADMQTYVELRGGIKGQRVGWVGAGSGLCRSYMDAAERMGFRLRIACPPGMEFDASPPARSEGLVELVDSPVEAVRDADLVLTGGWMPNQQEREVPATHRVDAALMEQASSDALVMHHLPLRRGAEIAAELVDGAQSVVWDEAENTLHAQKALLEFLLGP